MTGTIQRASSATADNHSFRIFPTRHEASTFIAFAAITLLIAAAIGLIGLFLRGRPQIVCVSLGFGALIPCYAWANRGPHAMRVRIPALPR
jgi:hypothetical protein